MGHSLTVMALIRVATLIRVVAPFRAARVSKRCFDAYRMDRLTVWKEISASRA